ncbi:hypothetical protein BGZ79_010929 [Entomortierella chlamydospora]|nr:hypothetical protein BGZ79_010929 [Entomortierella chlamydospora]
MMHHFLASIKLSKSEAEASRTAANAVTIIVRANVQSNGSDLRSVRNSGANLTTERFYSAQLQDADLTDLNFSKT